MNVERDNEEKMQQTLPQSNQISENDKMDRGGSFDLDEFNAWLGVVFNAFFDRDPEKGIENHYAALARDGLSERQIVAEFAQSPEYVEKKRHRLFVQRGHHYSPIPNVDEARTAIEAASVSPAPEDLPGLYIEKANILSVWQDLLPYMSSAPFPNEKRPEFHYWFDNPNFAYGDGVVLHAMLRHFRPSRILEVGSGHSTANMVDTNIHYLDGSIRISCVEPFPDLVVEVVGDAVQTISVYPNKVQDVDLSLVRELRAGDLLFIDSTHVLRTGSDVCWELFRMLPEIADGVIVHFHDIFWPFEYPYAWAIDENRAWNEVYAVRAFLMYNPEWEVLMFNDYIAKVSAAQVQETLPRFLSNPGGSLYVRKRASDEVRSAEGWLTKFIRAGIGRSKARQ